MTTSKGISEEFGLVQSSLSMLTLDPSGLQCPLTHSTMHLTDVYRALSWSEQRSEEAGNILMSKQRRGRQTISRNTNQ